MARKPTGKPRGRPISSVKSAKSIYMPNSIWKAVDEYCNQTEPKTNRSALSEKLHRDYFGIDDEAVI